MTKLNARIKLRLSLNLSKDDLGLIRLYNELATIESDPALTADQISEAKRRHLLGILYQYSHVAMAPFPFFTAVASDAAPATQALTVANPISATICEPIFRALPVMTEPVAKSPELVKMNALSEKALTDIGMGFVDTNPSS